MIARRYFANQCVRAKFTVAECLEAGYVPSELARSELSPTDLRQGVSLCLIA